MITDSTSVFQNPTITTDTITAILSSLGGLATFIISWKAVLKPIWQKHMDKQKQQEELLTNQTKIFTHIENMTEKILEISKELKPNAGGSIKDQVKQIANDVRVIRVERDATFHLAKEPMFKTDGKGYYISCNSSLCSLIGVSEQELLGLGWLNYISLEDKDRIWEEWEKIIESGKEISTYYTIKNPQTMDSIPVKCRAVINRDSSNIVSIIGTIEKSSKKIIKN